MNSSNTNFAANASNHILSELYFCPFKPIFYWVLSDITTLQITVAASFIACPLTILLNIFVIIAVKQRRELQKKSNILLASMAVADFIVGAVSIPLTITTSLLALHKVLDTPYFCRMAFVNFQVVLRAGSCSSLYHLTLIAWERYVAIRKWRDYKVIVTRKRLKRYARIAWLLTALITILSCVTKISIDEYKYSVILQTIFTLPAAVCIILIGCLYCMVYLGVRKRKVSGISQVRALIRAKLATKIAKTTATMTAALLISFIPSFVILFFGHFYPALRKSSFFLWAVMLSQLNSLFNPVLYCYRDRRFRNAILEMFKVRKPPKIKTETGLELNVRRIGLVASSGDLREAHEGEQRARVTRSRSCGSISMYMRVDHVRQTVMDRRISVPSCDVNRIIVVDIHHPNPIGTKPEIQVESRRKPEIHVESGTITQTSTSDHPQNFKHHTDNKQHNGVQFNSNQTDEKQLT